MPLQCAPTSHYPLNLIYRPRCYLCPDLFKFVNYFQLRCYTCLRPVVSYGGEAWTLTKKEEQALLIFERKIFRRVYGPKYENGEWKSRTNRELEEMSKGENIVKWIKGQRIS